MFKKQQTVHVELSEETKTRLDGLDNDVQALVGLVDELVAAHTAILEVLRGDVAVLVANAVGVPVDGVTVMAETTDQKTEVEQPTLVPEQKEKRPAKKRIAPPDSMAMQSEFEGGTDENGEGRVRATPFTRAPRHVQIDWLIQVMADGDWYAAIAIAREYATDERHFRYMKGALGGRLREMHEEGKVDRRDSHQKGSMFEYRLKAKFDPPKAHSVKA